MHLENQNHPNHDWNFGLNTLWKRIHLMMKMGIMGQVSWELAGVVTWKMAISLDLLTLVSSIFMIVLF
jgi:hypothetical protein